MMSINIIKSGNTFALLAVIIVKITEKEKIMRKDIKKGKDLPLQEHTLDQWQAWFSPHCKVVSNALEPPLLTL